MYKTLLNAIPVVSIFLGVMFVSPALLAQDVTKEVIKAATTSADQTATDNQFRDPTAPLGYSAGAKGNVTNSQYTLNAVLISAQRKHAIINGVTLREGQVIPGSGGVVVKRISPQTVALQQGTKNWALRLSPSVVIRH